MGPLFLSFQVAFVATFFAGLVGIAVAGLLARARFVGRDLIDALISAPMVLPPTVLGFYLLNILGREGTIGKAFENVFGAPLVFSKSAAIVAAFVAALPFVVKSARAAMEDVDPTLLEAASTLGASPLRRFMSVVLPLSRNGILAGLSLAFARALGEFGITLMIAGNLPGITQTGSLALYDAVLANRNTDANAIATVMAAFALVVLYGCTKLVRGKR